MGRNILSICDNCEEYIFHLRGKEGDYMQKFQNIHLEHEHDTRIVSDYVTEQPDSYADVTEEMFTTALGQCPTCKQTVDIDTHEHEED